MQIPAHAPNDSLRRIGIPPGHDPTGRPWYQQAAAAGKPVVTPPYVDAGTGKLVVAFAAPVVRAGGARRCGAGSGVRRCGDGHGDRQRQGDPPVAGQLRHAGGPQRRHRRPHRRQAHAQARH
ncbi:hypothetical protein CBM2623_A20020 [Cupriavidus taiwanensis]|nr:hypothetical protein CBM2608_A20019 [Cupriavidus taiwanensis]SPA26924.1 hypothetical protein CBM2623_A20020 [Cupriavidus taiwanensis]